MYPGVQRMLGFKEFTLHAQEPYLMDVETNKAVMYIDSKSSALVQGFARLADMGEWGAKQAGDHFQSALHAPYLKESRPNTLTVAGVTAGFVHCTRHGGFTRNTFAEISQGDVVVKSVRPAIHLTWGEGVTFANTCPTNLARCWNAVGLFPEITKSGLIEAVKKGSREYKRMKLEVKYFAPQRALDGLGKS